MSESEKPTLFRPGSGREGMTDLHAAAHAGDVEALAQCLKAGVDPNIADSYRGYTALHWLTDMAATGGPRLEMLQLLVRAGVDVNAKAGDGTTALQLALEAGNNLGEQLAEELIKLGATGGDAA